MTAGAWSGTFAALCAILVGVGLARFAYTPLIPALVEERWFTPPEAAYLGAANLAGYLAGALLGPVMAARIPVRVLLRGMMLAAAVSFLSCAAPLPFAWFFLWRFVSGLAGAVLMVLAAPTVLPHVPAERRGLAGGVIFTSVGLGIAASGTLIPLLLGLGLRETWIGLGLLSLALTLAAWTGWPHAGPLDGAQAAVSQPPLRTALRLGALYLEYALNAVGVVPHMVFLVDFIARGLERGVAVGSWHWVLFGIGAITGPVLAGGLADRIGFGPALRVALLTQTICVGWLALRTNGFALVVSCVVVGAFLPGSVSLVLGRVRELAHGEGEAQRAWTFATLAFAIGQAIAAYGFSFLFSRTGSYALLFGLGAAALALAFIIDLAVGASRQGMTTSPADEPQAR
jgi:predicted MFS family arabinose efflux permease